MRELRAYACLFLRYLVNLFAQKVEVRLVLQHLPSLEDAHIVGLAHQVVEGLHYLLIELVQPVLFGIGAYQLGQCCHFLHVRLVVGLEWNGLQPHHRAEIVSEGVVAGVVTAWTEQAVFEHHVFISEEVRRGVLALHHLVIFALGCLVIFWLFAH